MENQHPAVAGKSKHGKKLTAKNMQLSGGVHGDQCEGECALVE